MELETILLPLYAQNENGAVKGVAGLEYRQDTLRLCPQLASNSGETSAVIVHEDRL